MREAQLYCSFKMQNLAKVRRHGSGYTARPDEAVTCRPAASRRPTETPTPYFNPHGPTPGALHGDDYPLTYDADGYPELPACLDRRPKLLISEAPRKKVQDPGRIREEERCVRGKHNAHLYGFSHHHGSGHWSWRLFLAPSGGRGHTACAAPQIVSGFIPCGSGLLPCGSSQPRSDLVRPGLLELADQPMPTTQSTRAPSPCHWRPAMRGAVTGQRDDNAVTPQRQLGV